MKLPKKVAAYIIALSILSILLIYFFTTDYSISSFKMLIFWSILAVITESLMILLPNGVGVSVGLAISLATIIIGGPLMASIVSAVGVMLRVPKIPPKGYTHIFNTPIYKTVFNVSQAIIVTGVSGLIYIAVGGIVGSFSFVPAIFVLLAYVILNSVIMAELVSLLNNQSFLRMWINNLTGVLPNAIAVGTIGYIIALAYIAYGAGAVLLFFGPLLLARFSFKLYIDMRNVYIETIHALNKSMEAKDAYTSGHASRVQEYAVKLARGMGLPEKKVQDIQTAAILHDIGKIGIDDSILKKPLKLSQEEYEFIQMHPVIGAEILKDVDFLKDIANIIKHHHERYDGKGYPDRLKGEEISIEASILAVADVYDAMTSDRPYRKGMDKETALNEIKVNAGTQFHPEVATMFLKLMTNYS